MAVRPEAPRGTSAPPQYPPSIPYEWATGGPRSVARPPTGLTRLRYISVFSGVGGLEHPTASPLLVCELDRFCQIVLKRRYDGVDIRGDITQLADPPTADVVAGGWPCQDLSSAGTLGGITASRSGLFFEMLRVARESGARTLVGENVPNLLTINRGRDFSVVLEALRSEGFRFVAWRVLNARSFGLPQERRRIFMVASKDRAPAEALHARIPYRKEATAAELASGFYWTAGKRAIAFSPGFAPALKIGATDEKGRSPVAVFWDRRVRKLSPAESLRLQGFEGLPVEDLSPSVILRMAGNAVPSPVGHFVMESVSVETPSDGTKTSFGVIEESGICEDGVTWAVAHEPSSLARNLGDFIDRRAKDSLSAQAAAGLIVRSVRSGHRMPRELFDLLLELTADRNQELKPSRANSFESLDAMGAEMSAYAARLPTVDRYEEAHTSSTSSRRRRIPPLDEHLAAAG